MERQQLHNPPPPSANASNGAAPPPRSAAKPRHSTQSPPPTSPPPLPPNADLPSPLSAISSPPYWLQGTSRRISQLSVDSVAGAGAIRLLDNTEDVEGEGACWARGVGIEEHVVVNGRGGGVGIGAFVVWIVRVETLRGGTIHIRKRYSEFVALRERLTLTFPLSEAAMPPLPPKGVISKFRLNFLEQRRIGLSYFLNCVLLNPEFSGSPVLKEFIFS